MQTTTYNGENLVFDKAPNAKAPIMAKYFVKSLKENVVVHPLLINGTWTLDHIEVKLNGYVTKEFRMSDDLSGHKLISISDGVFADDDPYHIKAIHGLSIEVTKDLDKDR